MKLVYKCRECDKPFVTEKALGEHLRSFHNIKVQDYYDKYIAGPDEGKCEVCGGPTRFYSLSTGYKKHCPKCINVSKNIKNDPNNEPCEKLCPICQMHVRGSNARIMMSRFSNHLKSTHNITNNQDYYDKYEKKPGEGICKVCGGPTTFRGMTAGYLPYCHNCKAKAAREKNIELIGIEKEFQEEQKEQKKSREEALNEYMLQLKKEVEKYEWEGERNSWLGGNRTKPNPNKNDLMTDNSLSYIDGQSFSDMDETLTDKEDNPFTDVFWL